ncbi:MAG: hypothetical protein ACKOCT_02985 [Alphaproteobacteria bacterium]
MASSAREPLPWRRLAILFALAAMLAPVVRSAVSARLAPPPQAPVSPLVAISPALVRSLSIRGEDVAGVYERSPAGWTFAPDGGAAHAVDPEVPEGFLRTVAGLSRLTQFVDPDAAAFGLERPRGVFTAGGDPALRVDIGDRNPTLTAVYVRVGASPDVVLVGSVLLWEWDKLVAEARRSSSPVVEPGGSR